MKYFFSFLLFCYSVGFAQPQIPKLKMWATDLTNTLSQSELQDLNTRLKSYQDTTSNQIVVLMIPSLEVYPIEMLAEETATKNKIGTEKNDNGILVLIAKDDRELRLEVGYGLEGAVPDAIASSIIRNVIRPRFRTMITIISASMMALMQLLRQLVENIRLKMLTMMEVFRLSYLL